MSEVPPLYSPLPHGADCVKPLLLLQTWGLSPVLRGTTPYDPAAFLGTEVPRL